MILKDITKVFDKVWHLGLKFQILQLNLPITLEKLLCDFQDDRQAKIKIGNYTGTPFALHRSTSGKCPLPNNLHHIH